MRQVTPGPGVSGRTSPVSRSTSPSRGRDIARGFGKGVEHLAPQFGRYAIGKNSFSNPMIVKIEAS
jgi:hypothetical protein